jgi:EpsI family protein
VEHLKKDNSSSRAGAYRAAPVLLACVVLVASGLGYRVVAAHLDRLGKAIRLPVPLANIPMEVGPWRGEDVPMSQAVLKVAGNDDYVNRRYMNEAAGAWVNLYVAYSGDPRTMLGHRPQVCYPAAGWQHEYTTRIEITSPQGTVVPCLLHRFHMAGQAAGSVVVLNFYVLNGKMTDDEGTFSGAAWRLPNISGNIARYVTQVQISSVLEKSVRDAAADFVDVVLKYLPEVEGVVAAAKEVAEQSGGQINE